MIGEAPAVADRRGVAGGANHDLRALVGAFARHLGEHAVMADDERDSGAVRALDHGNADVAGLPRLDRNPGMEFAVVELDFAAIVDDQPGIIGIAARVELHDREAAPDLVVDAGLPERRDLGTIETAHDLRIGIHRQSVQRIFGKYHEIHGGKIPSRLADHGDDAFGLAGQIGLGRDNRQLELNEPNDDAFG